MNERTNEYLYEIRSSQEGEGCEELAVPNMIAISVAIGKSEVWRGISVTSW